MRRLPALPNIASILAALPAVPIAIPDADPIPLPAPIGLFRFLLVLTFLLHLLPMNFVLGGSLLTLVSGFRARRTTAEAAPHHRRLMAILARAFPVTIAFTITLGIAPLLFVQVLYGQLFFSSSILMAWLWLSVVALLLLGYYAAYWHAYRGGSPDGAGRWVVLAVAAPFLAVAFLFVNNFSLLQNPGAWRSLYVQARGGFHLYALSGVGVFARFLHFVLAALALSGLVVAGIGLRFRRKEPAFGGWAASYGACWFLGATILQMGSGIWFLLAQPTRVRNPLLGESPVDTLLLAAAVGCAVVALAVLVPPGRISAGRLGLGSAAIGLTLVLMVLIRQRVRTFWLEPHFRYEQLPVASQWGAILLFAVILLAGVGCVGWMLRQFFRQPAGTSPGG